ncbi:hypothetical protein, partial [Streptomyces sp. P17]|uniref:hypothetical protein n=1 Tax=Streptomyces sp. P17 TaxID=3074716 RepID=UPI0028F4264A
TLATKLYAIFALFALLTGVKRPARPAAFPDRSICMWSGPEWPGAAGARGRVKLMQNYAE